MQGHPTVFCLSATHKPKKLSCCSKLPILLSDMPTKQGKEPMMDHSSEAKYFKCFTEGQVFVVNAEQSPGKHTMNYHQQLFSAWELNDRGGDWQATTYLCKADNLSFYIRNQTQCGTNHQWVNSFKCRATSGWMYLRIQASIAQEEKLKGAAAVSVLLR